MGEQRNLTENNVAELKIHLDRMKKENPDLEYRFFKQDEAETETEADNVSMDSIMKKLESIERSIKHIFDGHVLINGDFKKIT